MSTRDREVLDLLRDEPELLAIADAVAETQLEPRRLRPFRVLGAVVVAAALVFALVLASPWDRGGEGGTVLERASAAVEAHGPVAHMTLRIEPPGSFHAVETETFYDRARKVLRVITRSDDAPYPLSDYTTNAAEDQFVTFPGLLDAADFYRKALASGRATVVGKGTWGDRPVYWVRLKKGGGLELQVGVDRHSYRPIVFRGLNPDRSSAGFQVSVLGLDYVSRADAHFQPDAPVLVTGRVVGPDCRPVEARVGVSVSPSSVEVASARSGRDGRFALRADPRNGAAAFDEAQLDGRPLRFTLVAQGAGGFGFERFSRIVKDSTWLGRPAVLKVMLGKSSSSRGC